MRTLVICLGLLVPLLAGASSAETPNTSATHAAKGQSLTFERPRVLVWELQAGSAKASTARSVAASVTRWASKNPHLEIISHADLANLLNVESNRLNLGLPNEDRIEEIAQKANAALVIFGQLSRSQGKTNVHLSLFETRSARALHREKVILQDLASIDDDLGRASNALVGRVLDMPALDLRHAAAELVDELPLVMFEKKSRVTTMKPFRYGATRFSSKFGKAAAGEVSAAIRRRAKGGKFALKKGFRLEGRYEPNFDMVELSLAVVERKTKRVAFRTQKRLIRGTVAPARLLPSKLALEERSRIERQATLGKAGDLIVDAWTEKGRIDVLFIEGESFHIYLKMNRPGYMRLIYHFSDGETRVLMEDAWPITEDQVGEVVRYHETFGPAAPFGVEHIEVIGYEKRPPPLKTIPTVIDGSEYPVIPKERGFVTNPGSRTKISITTTPR